MEKKIIGILGGMGPLATADLFQKIILHTRAETDQQHLHVIVDSNTNIPDRTAALLHGSADPTPELVKSARRLADAGAEVLIMPCNTAHNFHAAVQAAVDIPVLHMIALTRDALLARGAETLILGCTELPLAFELYDLHYPTADPTLELALGAIRFAGGTVKE